MFCKKPPALIGAEAREIAEEAARRGLTLACNFQLRQYFEFQHLPKCQAERLLGDIYHIGARFRRRQGTPGWGSFTDKAAQGGGALLDPDGRIDLALVLLAYARPEQVLANTFDHLGRGLLGSWDPARFSVEDASTAYLAFPGNRSVSLTTAFLLN